MGKWLWIVAALLLSLPGCGSDDTPTRPNTFTPLTSIVIEADLTTLAQGTSTQLVAWGNYSGLFTRDITNQVTWNSEQSSVADFLPSTPGRIKTFAPGPATITASLAGVEANPIVLSVSSSTLTALSIAPQLPSLPQGLSQSFTVVGTFSDSTTQDLTFDAFWESTDVTVATISNDVANKGETLALKIGATVISATFAAVSGGTTLTVIEPLPVSIAVKAVTTSQLSLLTQPFTATGTYSDGSTRDITTNVLWSSSNAAVASVATDGMVKTLTPGSTTISATLDAIVGMSNLKVTGGSLTRIDLNLDSAEPVKGTSRRVTAIGTFDNGTSRDITGAIETWAVTPGAQASVSGVTGNLAWVDALEETSSPLTLSASVGAVKGEKILTVSAPPLSSLSISENALTLATGSSGRLTLAGIFSSVNTRDLTFSADWLSSTSAIASVGDIGLEKGRVHALTAGTTNITSTYGGQTATTTVTVVARTLQSLTILPVTSPTPIIAGTEKKFKVEALYTDGTRQDVTADVTWTIDNLNIAIPSDTIANPGLFVAVDTGTATLTATFGGLNDIETLVVTQ